MGTGKATAVRGMLSQFGISFIAIQETQFVELSERIIRSFWDKSSFEFSKVNSESRSGGLLSMWNPNVFNKEQEVKSQNFILVKGKIKGEQEDLIIVNVYASTNQSRRRQMWDELLMLKQTIQGRWIMLGDFNEVRIPEERFNSQFYVIGAICFNNFIRNGGFQEYNIGGKQYTFMSTDGRNLSKIDQVLVCGEFMAKWPDASLMALNREISDHSLLILMTTVNRFGPTPF
ncbi:uncharacterized protein LOC110943799 [Helianthus annuus]|uniref:uncharacterized protein LOC110943799 n=1 Tax=Helianthus annuus TaxID=4232 RepID=UPI000B8FC959|nr:uncharacterized protein LOC110943799 [Helianthus annuus]